MIAELSSETRKHRLDLGRWRQIAILEAPRTRSTALNKNSNYVEAALFTETWQNNPLFAPRQPEAEIVGEGAGESLLPLAMWNRG